MKRILILGLALSFTFTLLASQAHAAGKKKPTKTASAEPETSSNKLLPDEFVLQLGLQASQKAKYEKYSQDYESKVGEAFQKLADAREGNRDKASLQKVADDEKLIKECADKLRAELEGKLVAVLTPEQKTKLEGLRKAYPETVAKKKGAEKTESKKPKKPK